MGIGKILAVGMCLCALFASEVQAKSTAPYEVSEGVERKGRETTLNDTVMSVLENHKALKIIQENRDVAVNELSRSKAGFGPRVDVVGRGGGSNLSDSTNRALGKSTGLYGATSGSITLTQPLWDGLATRGRVHSSQGLLDSVTSRVIDNATTLALDGLIAHVDLIWRRETLRLADENVKRHQEILASTKDREATGVDTMANVTQTQGRLSRALSTLSQSQASLLQGEASYMRLTERPLPSALQAVRQPVKMYKGPEEVVTMAHKYNPKLIAYMADVRTAQGDKEIAESAYQPVINLEAGPSYTNRAGIGEQWTTGVDIMGTVRWNIFNSGADLAANKASAARIRQARQVAMNFVDEVQLEITNTWTQYQAAIEQLGYYEEAIVYNMQTRDYYTEQFLMGQRTLLDVLDAESELFNSSTQAVTARANIVITSYRMFALAGVLLSELGIDSKPLLDSPDKKSRAGR